MPPHLDPVGTVDVVARGIRDSLYDVGAPVLGRPVLPPGPRPVVSSGESIEEALADPEDHETRHDLVELPGGGWTTRHPLGFRYLVVRSDAPLDSVTVRASVPVVARPGAFACSDDQLTRIWAAAQYTLRLCMQGLMIDGIKRDRMPWAGDQALSTLANAYALGEGGVVADGLVALGRPDHGYVNGIADYSLWWVVNSDLRLRCFGDEPFARSERSGSTASSRTSPVTPAMTASSDRCPSAAGSSTPDRDRCSSTGASRSSTGGIRGAADALVLGAAQRRARARPHRPPRRRAMGGARRHARGHPPRPRLAGAPRALGRLPRRARVRRPATYANFLAVLAGMHETDVVRGTDGAAVDAGVDVPPGVIDAVRVGVAGTPFMTAFRLRALLAAGDAPAVLDEVRSTWGAMLDRGPGTFWEESSIDDEPFAMYGRAFGRSLCHAWASGPAAILPEAVLGLRPLDDGWSRFEVRPDLGDLEWAAAVVPAPGGDIVVVADVGSVTVQVPSGSVLVREGHAVPGPAAVEWVRPRSAVFGEGTAGLAASGA